MSPEITIAKGQVWKRKSDGLFITVVTPEFGDVCWQSLDGSRKGYIFEVNFRPRYEFIAATVADLETSEALQGDLAVRIHAALTERGSDDTDQTRQKAEQDFLRAQREASTAVFASLPASHVRHIPCGVEVPADTAALIAEARALMLRTDDVGVFEWKRVMGLQAATLEALSRHPAAEQGWAFEYEYATGRRRRVGPWFPVETTEES